MVAPELMAARRDRPSPPGGGDPWGRVAATWASSIASRWITITLPVRREGAGDEGNAPSRAATQRGSVPRPGCADPSANANARRRVNRAACTGHWIQPPARHRHVLGNGRAPTRLDAASAVTNPRPRSLAEWEPYSFDTRERAKAGYRSREWTAFARCEVEVVREMARCLRLIREGRAPEPWTETIKRPEPHHARVHGVSSLPPNPVTRRGSVRTSKIPPSDVGVSFRSTGPLSWIMPPGTSA